MTPEIEKLQLNCQDANVHIEISWPRLSHNVETGGKFKSTVPKLDKHPPTT